MQVIQVIQAIQVKQFIHVICTSYRIYTERVTISSCAIWWPNLQLMQVALSGGQICNKCKWHHLVVKFSTNASGAMLLPNLVQVTESIFGSIGNVYKKDPECIFFAIDILCVEFIRY